MWLNLYMVNFYNPAIVHISMHQIKMSALVHQKTCTIPYIVAFSIIAKNWKQLKCPSTVDTLQYIHTMEHCKKKLK